MIIGKNILENLTTGMYADSKVSYREYIQNACDQIDKAIVSGLVAKGDASVEVDINTEKRYVSIKDNATGVPADLFRSNIGDIANSDKKQGESKGFRGIGRLCGLAYCKTLKFTASYSGENIASVAIFDAEKMRKMLVDNKKYTLDEIMSTIMSFDTFDEVEEEHYFNVELIDINRENTDLLDTRKVIDYLSFVAPVPYRREFLMRGQIYQHAKEIGYNIDEYNIYVNGEQVLKEYTSKLKEQSGNNLKNYDEISKLEFKDFVNSEGELIAWMWVGLSRFEKAIPKLNLMQGIRARQANIQIGDYDVFKSLFKEERGNRYFVGEVFTNSSDLIANSQRDYFNETEIRVFFEDSLRCYFYDTLHNLYTKANVIKNAYKKQEGYLAKSEEFEKKSKSNSFIDNQERLRLEGEVEKAKNEADKARKQLSNYDTISGDSPIAEVKKQISAKFNSEELSKKVSEVDNKPCNSRSSASKKNGGYAVDALSKLNKSERKLISKIWSVITNNAPKDIAESLIEKIKEEFK